MYPATAENTHTAMTHTAITYVSHLGATRRIYPQSGFGGFVPGGGLGGGTGCSSSSCSSTDTTPKTRAGEISTNRHKHCSLPPYFVRHITGVNISRKVHISRNPTCNVIGVILDDIRTHIIGCPCTISHHANRDFVSSTFIPA